MRGPLYMGARGRRPGSPERLCKIAVDLKRYLDQDIDPHDFSSDYFLEQWNEAYPDLAVDPDSGEPPESKLFAEWVRDTVVPELMRHDPTSLPGYVYFDGPRLLPKGSWLVHFSRERFDVFEYGTTFENLALSTWNRTKDEVSCARNRYPDASLYEIVWGFAFDAGSRDVSSGTGAKKYGSNVVLFQTDCAVLAHHSGDEEYQAIFPLCSEYNRHSGSYSSGTFYFEGKNGEERDFDDIDDAVEAARSGRLR
jgi:hypothetical protein